MIHCVRAARLRNARARTESNLEAIDLSPKWLQIRIVQRHQLEFSIRLHLKFQAAPQLPSVRSRA